MDRLTRRDDGYFDADSDSLLFYVGVYGDTEMNEVLYKLALYEDTGLSPEEVMQYKALGGYEEIRDGLAEFRRLLAVAEPYLTCRWLTLLGKQFLSPAKKPKRR